MLLGFRSIRDFDLEFKVNLKNFQADDDFCFLKTLINDEFFVSILSFFNGYYFHTSIKENSKDFKEGIYKMVVSFNPVVFSQDFNLANDFFQKIFECKNATTSERSY